MNNASVQSLKVCSQDNQSINYLRPAIPEIVNIGNGNIILSCKKLCLERPDYILNNLESDQQFNKQIKTTYVEQKKDLLISMKNNLDLTKISYLPKSIMNSFDPNELNKINTDLDSSVIILEYTDIDLEENKIKILTCHSNFCIRFDMNKIIFEILRSYSVHKSINYIDEPTKKIILRQIEIDFPRMHISYNHKKCNNFDHFISLMEKFDRFSHDKLCTLYYLIIMFCTQASFYYSYSVIHNVYSLPSDNIYILPFDDSPYVNIIDNNNHVDIVFKKIFRCVNIDSGQIITKFHTFMIVSIDLIDEPNGYIFYGRKYGECNTGALYWIKENNLIVL
jgi:hypothetical protein